MENIKLIIFDWEGTLSDTWGRGIAFVNNYARSMNWQMPTMDQYKSVFRIPLEKAVSLLFPDKSLEQHLNLLQYVQENLWQNPNVVAIFPGVRECLLYLKSKNIELAVASNKSAAALHKALVNAELNNMFTIVCSASETEPKPSTKMLELILDFCDVSKSSSLMIGDSELDIIMANNFGIKSVAFDFYSQFDSSLYLKLGASTVINNMLALLDLLNLGRYD